MSVEPHFPNDANGDVFRRMVASGKDLSQPRVIDFSFVFPERRQALAFVDLVEERQYTVSISYYELRNAWDVKVSRQMVPTHKDVTAIELALGTQARSVGGEPDGWGCFAIKREM